MYIYIDIRKGLRRGLYLCIFVYIYKLMMIMMIMMTMMRMMKMMMMMLRMMNLSKIACA